MHLSVSVMEGHTGDYDAYLSCADEDLERVKEVAAVLEKNNLSVFIRQIHELAGISRAEATTALIINRCHKTLLFFSPAFNESDECRFHVELLDNDAIGKSLTLLRNPNEKAKTQTKKV